MQRSEHSAICVNIGIALKIRRRSPKVGEPLVKVSHTHLYPSQMTKLEKIVQTEGKAKAEAVREVVKRFLNKPTHEREDFIYRGSSPGRTEKVYPRFSETDWDVPNEVSKTLNRHRTDLVREPVGEDLGNYCISRLSSSVSKAPKSYGEKNSPGLSVKLSRRSNFK